MRDSMEPTTIQRLRHRVRRARDAAPAILLAVGLIAALASGVALAALARFVG